MDVICCHCCQCCYDKRKTPVSNSKLTGPGVNCLCDDTDYCALASRLTEQRSWATPSPEIRVSFKLVRNGVIVISEMQKNA